MTVLELMAKCRYHVQEIRRLDDRMEELDATVIGRGLAIGSAPGGGGAGGDQYAAYMARKDELERQKQDASRALAAEQMAAILLTGNLPDLARKCLRGFYCYGMSAGQIARKEGYTVSNIYKAMAAAKAECCKIGPKAVEEALPGWYVQKYLMGGDVDDASNL